MKFQHFPRSKDAPDHGDDSLPGGEVQHDRLKENAERVAHPVKDNVAAEAG